MAIQTNGNEQQREFVGRNLINPSLTPAAPVAEQVLDDLAARMTDVVAQLREIARYTTDYADNLQKGLLTYERGIQQKLGKVGK